jgi:hypothetical protein
MDPLASATANLHATIPTQVKVVLAAKRKGNEAHKIKEDRKLGHDGESEVEPNLSPLAENATFVNDRSRPSGTLSHFPRNCATTSVPSASTWGVLCQSTPLPGVRSTTKFLISADGTTSRSSGRLAGHIEQGQTLLRDR